jgi:NAD(P)-dependent dehydrogenase (short-subunit alcohol dehydrogenase family)
MAIVLITGCSTGIGFATAELLARNGHKVYATMRNPQSSQDLQSLAQNENLPVTVLTLDVNSDDSVKQAVNIVLDKEDYIDVLVNNAGMTSIGAVEELPMELYKSEMNTNFFGTVRCIQAVLPGMRERKSGCIINISSAMGRLFTNFQSIDSASKDAVEAFSECHAQEVYPFNIRVALVEPGIIETPQFLKENDIPSDTHYPNVRRLMTFFAASLENHTKPVVVSEVIKDIIEGKSTKFRNTAGPDAAPLLKWRASLTDEEFIKSVNTDDETWLKTMGQELNLNLRHYIEV